MKRILHAIADWLNKRGYGKEYNILCGDQHLRMLKKALQDQFPQSNPEGAKNENIN